MDFFCLFQRDVGNVGAVHAANLHVFNAVCLAEIQHLFSRWIYDMLYGNSGGYPSFASAAAIILFCGTGAISTEPFQFCLGIWGSFLFYASVR